MSPFVKDFIPEIVYFLGIESMGTSDVFIVGGVLGD
jgi:hypothetical protein